jgi:hypothetical protein
VRVTICREGLQLDLQAVALRTFFPPLFLPWKDIVSAQREGGWFWEQVRLTVEKAPDDPVTITGSLADRILSTLGPVWNERQVVGELVKALSGGGNGH